MKLLFNTDVFGYRMTGLLGAGKNWFLGFSRALPLSGQPLVVDEAEPATSPEGHPAPYKTDGVVIRGPWASETRDWARRK
jgi:hypothetical protein